VDAYSWLIRTSDANARLQRTRFVEGLPAEPRSMVSIQHPKLHSLQKWILRFYDRAELVWLSQDKEKFRFKLLIYVKHVETARALNPQSRGDDAANHIGLAVQKKLEHRMSLTMRKIALRHRDLFFGGRLSTPCSAIERCLRDLGWNSISKLAVRNRTLALAALVNAHHGHSTNDKCKRFRRTLSGVASVDLDYERYHRVLSRNPKMRLGVLHALGAEKIVKYESALKEEGSKLTPSLLILDPRRMGLELPRKRLQAALKVADIHRAFVELDSNVGKGPAAPVIDAIQALQRWLIKLVSNDEDWSLRVKIAARQPKSTFKRLWFQLGDAHHRPAGVVSVQTGADSGSRDHVLASFRSLGNPFILALTNVGTVGVDLNTYCWDVLHYTAAWTPHEAEQKTGRIDRPRLKIDMDRLHLDRVSRARFLRVHHLIWPLTVDERILSRQHVRTILAERLLGARNARQLEEQELKVQERARDYPPLNLRPDPL
jgi:hypothetical protein